jgi:hypothetical protein
MNSVHWINSEINTDAWTDNNLERKISIEPIKNK